MGDQKDHMTIQKKETETATSEVETQDFEMATESQAPPSLQLKADEPGEKEGAEGVMEQENAYQFSTSAPPENPGDNASKIFGGEAIQGKGIAEPFKIPIIQKKELNQQPERNTDKPSFTL